ncbi:MAG: hypothetical protein E6R03_00660 [Hyphomicrobiaceae bacterium]|nr:MAG: hypothetical protein E6R03_00660 [Hyphomicrobiaceae bacterium]
MASIVNNCIFTPTAGGTGTWTFSAAVTGYNSPAQAGVTDAKIYRYRAQSADLSQWEIGTTTAGSSATTFTRSVTKSSNSNSAVNFTTAPRVSLTFFASEFLLFDDAMSLNTTQQAQARANINAAQAPSITSVTSNTSITAASSQTVLVDATGGAVTITLFAASAGNSGSVVRIKKTDSSTNSVIVVVSGGANIDNSTSAIISARNAVLTLQCNSSQWYQI